MKSFGKLTFMFLAILGMSMTAFTTQNEKVITVDRVLHDFGTISEDGGNVSAIFTITNNTNEAIVLTNVRASCGCTTPSWTKEPIEPGKTGTVTATYSPKGRPGPFEKTVTITTTGNPEKIVVRIKGTVETVVAQ
jgi:hypothetical protein